MGPGPAQFVLTMSRTARALSLSGLCGILRDWVSRGVLRKRMPCLSSTYRPSPSQDTKDTVLGSQHASSTESENAPTVDTVQSRR